MVLKIALLALACLCMIWLYKWVVKQVDEAQEVDDEDMLL